MKRRIKEWNNGRIEKRTVEERRKEKQKIGIADQQTTKEQKNRRTSRELYSKPHTLNQQSSKLSIFLECYSAGCLWC